MQETAEEVRTNSLATFSNGALHMDMQVLAYQELIYNSSVRTQDIVLKTFQKRWMIEMNGERESFVGKRVFKRVRPHFFTHI